MTDERLKRFRSAYAEHRAAEGRGSGGAAEVMALPYLRTGPHARGWRVRACTFDRFVESVMKPAVRAAGRPLRVLDAGAGNGWLCNRIAGMGHEAVALDVRTDDVDGLGAARGCESAFARVAAAFEALPVRDGTFDMVVFNAALHYAQSLDAVLAEAVRAVAAGGRIVVLDSPFYTHEADGDAMVAQKRAHATTQFGDRAGDLLALPFIEFLTHERLADASAPLGLEWRRHRVRYPLWYEARPLVARVRRRRAPSRFDVWEASVR